MKENCRLERQAKLVSFAVADDRLETSGRFRTGSFLRIQTTQVDRVSHDYTDLFLFVDTRSANTIVLTFRNYQEAVQT